MVRTRVRGVGTQQGEGLPKNCGYGGEPNPIMQNLFRNLNTVTGQSAKF